MMDLCTFEELNKHVPNVKCPECGCEMINEGQTLGNEKHPTHELDYSCLDLDCATTLFITLDKNFNPIKGEVVTFNHDFQEMYRADLEKSIVTEICPNCPTPADANCPNCPKYGLDYSLIRTDWNVAKHQQEREVR